MYSTAAWNRSARVGKWCCAAPRDTPARLATTLTVVAAYPTSASDSSAASSSRCRVARERSCWGALTASLTGSLAGPQLTAQDLPGRRLRHRVDELDLPDLLVRRHP